MKIFLSVGFFRTTHKGWASEQGVLKISSTASTMTLDSNVMADWGVLGANSKIGGTGVTEQTLYYGFLVQCTDTSGGWSGGPVLCRDGYEVLGLSYHKWTSETNMGGYFYERKGQSTIGLNFANDPFDTNTTHLFVVKLTYGESADEATIYIDPDMSKAESEQNSVHTYTLSELTGVSNQDLSFDSIVFRGGNSWTYDEWRMAQSWWNISDYTITDVATAEKLTDTWTIDDTNIRVSFTSERDSEKDADHSGELVMEANGTIAVEDGFNLTQSGIVSGSGKIEKIGDGTLTLTNANTYSGGTTISEGTVKLTGDGTLGTGSTTINNGTLTLENGGTIYNLSGNSTGTINANNHDLTLCSNNGADTKYDGYIQSAKTITKSGNGDLKILLQAQGQISADKIVVSSGRLDIKSALLGKDDYVALESNIDVLKDATFSPGNSVGILQLAAGETIHVESGGKLLVEVDSSGMDKIVYTDDGGKVDFQPGSILELATIDGYTPSLGGDITQTLFTNIPGIEKALKDKTTSLSSYYYQLKYDASGNIIGVGVNPNAVPEPSTWALLILGFVGLMWYRRKK